MFYNHLNNIFDQEYTSNITLDELIEKLKKRGLSQGEIHLILYRKLKDKYTFEELRNYIINSPCWSESLSQNDSIDDEFMDFFDNK